MAEAILETTPSTELAEPRKVSLAEVIATHDDVDDVYN